MRAVRLRPTAEADLEAIALFIAEDSPRRALGFVRSLRARCERLGRFPLAAPLRRELGEGVRVAVFRRYLILHTAEPDAVVVERVVHGARDVLRLLGKA